MKNRKNYEVLRRPGWPASRWLTIRLENRWYVQTQVFDRPSGYGIGGRDEHGDALPDDRLPSSARISRLCITPDARAWGPAVAVYNFDRGLDYDRAPAGLVEKAIAACLSAAGQK